MPLIFKEKFEEDCLLGIWEIRESFDELFSEVQLHAGEKERLFGFRSNARKLEFLSVRILLKALIGVSGPIVYSDRQKPFLQQSDYRISITHSRKLTAIMLSKTKKVGIDLEYMSHKISKVAHKFINENEYITSDDAQKKYHLYIHWCAKEALYKLCDKQEINFLTNLTIEPFDPTEFGIINGWVDNKFWHDKFELSYFSMNNYIVVYTCKNI
jgi:4'-phosphopantetheinyl transferase EntD